MLISSIKLTIAAIIPVIAAAIFAKIEKNEKWKRLPYASEQLLYGVVFGIIAIIGTEWGISMNGAMVNCRDAAPVIAGLFFGGPAGIIAGVIGGVERWFAVYWGVGEFTRVACSVSTVLAGILAAFLRKVMYEGKRPTWFLALFSGVSIEVLHLSMVFITNVDNAEEAIRVVKVCTAPMVSANGLAVMLTAIVLYAMASDQKIVKGVEVRSIFETIQNWLLGAILFAFLVVSGFMIVLQSNLAIAQIDQQLDLSMEEVAKDIADASDSYQINLTRMIAKEIEETHYNINKLADKYNISEISIINEQGMIIESSNEKYVGFDMSSGKQSEEFLCLLNGEKEYVQPYGPIAVDENISMKYAGVALRVGFVQTGFNAEQFQDELNNKIKAALKNRHVGKNGFFLVFDEKGDFVSASDNYDEKNTFDIKELDTSKFVQNKVTRTAIKSKDYFYTYDVSEGYGLVAICSAEDATAAGLISIYLTIFDMILVFALLFVIVYILIKKLVVNQIVSMANSLGRISAGNLDEVVDVRNNAEFASLSDDINTTVDTLKRYIEEAASRIDAELQFAKDIQLAALPSHFPAFPNRSDFDIYARMDTAKEVGGDFYDFFFTDTDQLNLVIADVSGKGIPAALFMMRAKSILRAQSGQGREIDEVFTEGNNMLCVGNDANMFVTAWEGVINLKDGVMNFANAGHNPPLVKHKDGKFEYLVVRPNLVLASMEDIPYKKHEITLLPGDVVYLYTDGVTEATDANNELYGEDRLIEFLNSREFSDMKDICDSVKADVDAFVGEAPQFDDMTMVAFTYKGTPYQQ